MRLYPIVLFLLLTACSDHSEKVNSETIGSKDSVVTSKALSTFDSVKVYAQAIHDYLMIVEEKEDVKFDTLYLTKNVYFQNNKFPDEIDKVHILIISPDELTALKGLSCTVINLVGWVNKEKGEFILVRFKPGGEHLLDYFINYTYNLETNNYERDKIWVENWRTKSKEIFFERKP
jgi:hypothetical protein